MQLRHMIPVDAKALRQVLEALNGPSHHIAELQAVRSLGGSPIDQLINDYNAYVTAPKPGT